MTRNEHIFRILQLSQSNEEIGSLNRPLNKQG